jgi:hypothetical protein
MTEEAKTYVFGNSDNSALMAAMANNGGFGGGGGWWAWIILMALWGGNGFGRNGQDTQEILSTLNGDQGRQMLMSAIEGNSTAISQLASSLHCDVNSIQTALNAVQASICQVGNTVGMTGMQIVNAVQAGDASLASKLAECCCENRLLTTTQGYENRIALAEQTSFLGAKIDNQTNIISDKFCELEKRELQNKIDTLREERSTLLGRISNAEQTAAIQGYIASVVTPLAADVAAIKCAQPPTVSVPYPQLAAVQTTPYCANFGTFGSFGPFGPFNGAWA